MSASNSFLKTLPTKNVQSAKDSALFKDVSIPSHERLLSSEEPQILAHPHLDESILKNGLSNAGRLISASPVGYQYLKYLVKLAQGRGLDQALQLDANINMPENAYVHLATDLTRAGEKIVTHEWLTDEDVAALLKLGLLPSNGKDQRRLRGLWVPSHGFQGWTKSTHNDPDLFTLFKSDQRLVDNLGSQLGAQHFQPSEMGIYLCNVELTHWVGFLVNHNTWEIMFFDSLWSTRNHHKRLRQQFAALRLYYELNQHPEHYKLDPKKIVVVGVPDQQDTNSCGFAVADAMIQVIKHGRIAEVTTSNKKYYKERKRAWKARISQFLGLTEVFGQQHFSGDKMDAGRLMGEMHRAGFALDPDFPSSQVILYPKRFHYKRWLDDYEVYIDGDAPVASSKQVDLDTPEPTDNQTGQDDGRQSDQKGSQLPQASAASPSKIGPSTYNPFAMRASKSVTISDSGSPLLTKTILPAKIDQPSRKAPEAVPQKFATPSVPDQPKLGASVASPILGITQKELDRSIEKAVQKAIIPRASAPWSTKKQRKRQQKNITKALVSVFSTVRKQLLASASLKTAQSPATPATVVAVADQSSDAKETAAEPVQIKEEVQTPVAGDTGDDTDQSQSFPAPTPSKLLFSTPRSRTSSANQDFTPTSKFNFKHLTERQDTPVNTSLTKRQYLDQFENPYESIATRPTMSGFVQISLPRPETWSGWFRETQAIRYAEALILGPNKRKRAPGKATPAKPTPAKSPLTSEVMEISSDSSNEPISKRTRKSTGATPARPEPKLSTNAPDQGDASQSRIKQLEDQLKEMQAKMDQMAANNNGTVATRTPVQQMPAPGGMPWSMGPGFTPFQPSDQGGGMFQQWASAYYTPKKEDDKGKRK